MVNALFKSNLTLPATVAASQVPAALQVTLCPSDRPLALLPVRIETRFFLQPDASYELRVRVYPDKIHIDSHEPDLTAAEQDWGKLYWEQCWRAGYQADVQANAWRQLAERFDAARAAWIVRVLRPSNPTVPVPVGQALSNPLQFPQVTLASGDTKDTAWRHAPAARLLPDRWIAIAYSAGQVAATATGNDITRPLYVGPDPQTAVNAADNDALDNEQLGLDQGMRWMVDFDTAETAGMALRLKVSAQLAAAGIDALLVLGTAGSMPAADAALQLGQLLDAHHYTDGLAFLKYGVPTNNTAEARSGYNEYDAGRARSFAAETTGIDTNSDADLNARQLGGALGLPPDRIADVLGRIPAATLRHSLDSRSMNTALWSGTWGYFLGNMIGMAGTGLNASTLAWAREHFISHVRSLGPFPALRCGRQPYGVLPVTSLDLWQPPAGEQQQQANDAWLRGMLIKLRDTVWRPHVAAVPRVGRTTEPAADLASVMRTEAQSSSYVTRSLLGRHYLLQLRAFMLENLAAQGWQPAHDSLTDPLPNSLQIAWRPRVTHATYADRAFDVFIPLVQEGEISAQRLLEPNYITALLAETTIEAIMTGHIQSGTGSTLLHALLRHCALLEYATAATAVLSAQGATFNGQNTTFENLIKDQELVNLMPASAPTMTWLRQLDQVVPAVTGTKKLREYLETLQQFQAPAVAALGAFKRSLAHLQSQDTESLQYLATGTLDLASHRLDAWITSLATKRLNAMRAAQPQGLYVGGYAWVENLKPAAAGTLVGALPGEPGPICAPPNDPGFIHAPSLAHAATAALLRNAHLGHNGASQPNGPFAIDLSSRRMRMAQQLLDGVRQGQPLAALLGYRLERRLHELSPPLDRFIAELRRIAPLAADRLKQAEQSQENVAANNVVDGLVLQQKWAAERTRLQTLAGASFAALEREVLELGETIDAVGDALTAEGTYQLVQGNTARTASTLQSVARGDAPPPELDVARTPRSGIALTHRVVALMNGAATSSVGWAGASSDRALANPVLSAWMCGLLGDPAAIRCVIERLDEGDAVVETLEVKLAALQLGALDAIFSVAAEAADGVLSELEQRLLYHVRRMANGFADNAPLRIQRGRPERWQPGDLTLHDLLEQARNARRLLARSRALDAGDLDLPERNTSGGVDLVELTSRTMNASLALKAARTALQIQLEKSDAANVETLRTAILKLSGFGIAGAVPVSATGEDPAQLAALQAQGATLIKEAQARIDQEAILAAQPVAATETGKRDALLQRLRSIFGQEFLVLPRFVCANAATLAASVNATVELQGGDPLAACTWFARGERVREPLHRMGTMLRSAEVLGNEGRLQLCVAQLPWVEHDRWVALPLLPGKSLPAGRLSLIIQSTATLNFLQPMAGLMVDEWVETVPSRNETTGIAFQFDPPDVCAPQSILLAVPPVPGTPWTGWDLQRVLLETLDLAKLRAVEPQALVELSQYLPALYFGFNAANAAVSTDFAALTR